MNLIKLERLTSFMLSIIVFTLMGLFLIGKSISINMTGILFIYVVAWANIVLMTYNRGGKINRLLSQILFITLFIGFVLGVFAAV